MDAGTSNSLSQLILKLVRRIFLLTVAPARCYHDKTPPVAVDAFSEAEMAHRYSSLWLPFLLVFSVLCGGVPAGLDDDLTPLWNADAEHVRQLILHAAQRPGGEEARKFLDAPVVLWVERCFLGSENAYSGEGIRYVVARLAVGNFTESKLVLKRDQIHLQAGSRTLHIGEKPSSFRDIPLEIDWHANDHLRSQSQLATPRQIEIPGGKSAAFWCVFAGLDAVPAIPDLLIKLDFEGGRQAELNINAQQRSRLALTQERIGPAGALAVFHIHGQLNRVNARTLAEKCRLITEQGGERILIDWAAQAQPSDEVLYSWLLTANKVGNENLLLAQLPQLPRLHQIVLAEIPQENRDVTEWEEADDCVFARPQAAAMAALREIYEQIDPRTALDELQSGHPWSQQAALLVAGDRLGPEALPQILRLVQVEDQDLRRAAILALGAQSAPEARARLMQIVTGKSPGDAESAFRSLLSNESPGHEALVLKLLADPQLRIPRSDVLRMLADAYRPAWNDDLSAAVGDADPSVRRIALEILSRLGHPDLTRLCITALRDPDEDVRETAFKVLVNRSDRTSEQAALAYAIQRLRDGHATEPILDFIERLRETRAAPLLLALLDKADTPHARLIEVIGEVGSSEHLRELFQRWDRLHPDEQVAALDLASELPITLRLEIARQASQSKEQGVRNAAIQVLKTVGTDQALDVLDQMLAKAPEQEREVICMTLGEIGSDSAIQRLREYRERSLQGGETSALSAVDQALRLWQARLPGWNFVESGYVHVQADDQKEALKSFSLAILINPELADAYSARGNVYLRMEQFSEAGKDFAEALRLDPFDGQAITGVAIVKAVGGHEEDAVKFVDEQAHRFPRDRFFAYNTACVYGRAIDALRRRPESAELQVRIAELQGQALKKLHESIDYGFNQFEWMQKDPDLAPFRDLPDFKKLIERE
jgi:HEAT repeat protein